MTADCLKTQLRQNYNNKIVINKPPSVHQYRVKITGCRHRNVPNPEEADLKQVENELKMSNKIDPQSLFTHDSHVLQQHIAVKTNQMNPENQQIQRCS